MTTLPWSSVGVLRLAAGNVVSVGMLGTGWLLVERGDDLGSQVAWLNLSIAGLLVALWINVRWLLDGRRAVGVVLRGIEGVQDQRDTRRVADPERPDAPVSFVAGDGLLRYHRSSCLLARGKSWGAATPTAHRVAGRSACGVCRP